MEFHAFGDKNRRTVMIIHGMLCDWQKFHELLMPLEEKFYVIYPAMTGCYEGSPDFVSFADECEQIEKYVRDFLDGDLTAVLGVSQGATLITELMARNRLNIKCVILDGVYLAHQGMMAAMLGLKAFLRMQKNGGKIPGAMEKVCAFMGIAKNEAAPLFSMLFMKGRESSMKANLIENYTYHVDPFVADTAAKVYLWCGSKEPFAKKSHEILKKYLRNYEERIFDGMGHGVMLYFHTEEYIKAITDILEDL